MRPEDPLKVMFLTTKYLYFGKNGRVKKETPTKYLSVKTNLRGLINVLKEAQLNGAKIHDDPCCFAA